MAFVRGIVGLPVALLITGALFLMMAMLINRDMGPLPAPQESPKISILPEIEPTKIRPDRTRPDRITVDPPEVEIPTTLPQGRPKGVAVPVKRTVDVTGPTGSRINIAPTIRVAPSYPESCRGRGAEGAVTVTFDVTPAGDVVNVRIISSNHSCFNRTVKNAVSRWKYPPAYRNGQPVTRHGVIEYFTFQLVD